MSYQFAGFFARSVVTLPPHLPYDAILRVIATPFSVQRWQTFTSKEGAFSIEMPGTPTSELLPDNSHKFMLTQSNYDICYTVVYSDLPRTPNEAEIKELLSLEAKGQLQQVDTPETERSLSILGYPGYEVTFRAPVRGGGESFGKIGRREGFPSTQF